MSPAINLPQVSSAGPTSDPGPTVENLTSDSAGAVPFAQVLKERSARPEASSGDKAATGETAVEPTDAGLTAVALAPQFLALLQGSTAIADDAAKSAATSVTNDAVADLTTNAATTAAPTIETQILITALPASLPPAPITATRAAPAPVRAAGTAPQSAVLPGAPGIAADAETASPYPTADRSAAAAAGHGNGQRGERSEATVIRTSEVKLAADPAKTAESPKLVAAAQSQAAVAEFKPLLERVAASRADGIALAPASMQPNAPTPAVSTPPALPVPTPVGQPAWAEDVGQRIGWMIGQGRQEAELVLNPPQLGRIEVTIVVQGDQVNASFSSPHQTVRDALESSLGRLREGLAESGITLGQTHVGRDSSRDAPFARNDGRPTRTQAIERTDTAALANRPAAAAWHVRAGRSMVDVFA